MDINSISLHDSTHDTTMMLITSISPTESTQLDTTMIIAPTESTRDTSNISSTKGAWKKYGQKKHERKEAKEQELSTPTSSINPPLTLGTLSHVRRHIQHIDGDSDTEDSFEILALLQKELVQKFGQGILQTIKYLKSNCDGNEDMMLEVEEDYAEIRTHLLKGIFQKKMDDIGLTKNTKGFYWGKHKITYALKSLLAFSRKTNHINKISEENYKLFEQSLHNYLHALACHYVSEDIRALLNTQRGQLKRLKENISNNKDSKVIAEINRLTKESESNLDHFQYLSGYRKVLQRKCQFQHEEWRKIRFELILETEQKRRW